LYYYYYVIVEGRHRLKIAVDQSFENGDMIGFEESVLLTGNIILVYHPDRVPSNGRSNITTENL
jgi:hypothetical protein